MFVQPSTKAKKDSPLTARQRQVLSLLAVGATRQSVARKLVLSEGTVNCYVSHILQRLNAQNVTHAVYLATRQQLLPLEDEEVRATPLVHHPPNHKVNRKS